MGELYLKEASSKVRRGTISKKSPGAAASAGAGPSSEFTAIMYKEYALIKINKAGKRQARVLGIDGDRLHNKTPQQAAGRRRTSCPSCSRAEKSSVPSESGPRSSRSSGSTTSSL